MATTILIIDHEVTAQGTLALLQQQGFIVNMATNAESGLRLAYRYQPDLVFLDVSIASQNAWELLKFLREISPSMPILLQTDTNNVQIARKGVQLTANGYLERPFNEQD